MAFFTFLGGSQNDLAEGMALDPKGNVYITGVTHSVDFPTKSAFQSNFLGGNYDTFVTKMDKEGKGILYSTYLGGGTNDYATSIAVDNHGYAYITGQTGSFNFPVTPNAIQGSLSGGLNIFVAKIHPSGSFLSYSTYLGGSWDSGHDIAVDSLGNAYVTGFASDDFPGTQGSPISTENATNNLPSPQAHYSGGTADAFISKINPTGTNLVYSTYLGGADEEVAYSIALDPQRNAYVTGYTFSKDFTLGGSSFQKNNGGYADLFVTKINKNGTKFDYSTYLGGEYNDVGFGIAVDPQGSAYVTGRIWSEDFPGTKFSQLQSALGGAQDSILTKLSPQGSKVVYSTYLGGAGYDEGDEVVVDAVGNAYVTGFTESPQFPGTQGSPISSPEMPLQNSHNGYYDAFVTKVNPDGTKLLFSTYLGGYGNDYGKGIFVNNTGDIYLSGNCGSSTGFPGSQGSPIQALQPPMKDTLTSIFYDAYVLKILLQ